MTHLLKGISCPLGSSSPPNLNRVIGDHLDCSVSNEMPWKIFEGCWHSFHLSCLNNVFSVCPICRQGVGDAIRSLASTANRSVQVQEISEVDGDDSSGQVENTANDNDDDDDDNEVLTSQVEANVDQVLQNLTQLVIALPVTSPPVQPAQPSLRTQTQTSQPPPPSQSSSQWKPPHCSTCGHTLQGHKRLVLMEASGKSCPLRPSKVCTREGRSTSCACHWCTRQPPTIPANRAFSSFSQVPCVVRETHKSRCN